MEITNIVITKKKIIDIDSFVIEDYEVFNVF